jgi:hypothetical protein
MHRRHGRTETAWVSGDCRVRSTFLLFCFFGFRGGGFGGLEFGGVGDDDFGILGGGAQIAEVLNGSQEVAVMSAFEAADRFEGDGEAAEGSFVEREEGLIRMEPALAAYFGLEHGCFERLGPVEAPEGEGSDFDGFSFGWIAGLEFGFVSVKQGGEGGFFARVGWGREGFGINSVAAAVASGFLFAGFGGGSTGFGSVAAGRLRFVFQFA